MTTDGTTLPTGGSTPKLLGVRLSVMMFLQYAVWGIWLPVLNMYLGGHPDMGGLGFTPTQIGWLYAIPAFIGAISAPFIAGQIADRYFSTERSLAVLLAAGGALWIAVSYATDFWTWMVLLTLSSVAYVPTIALSNSLAFANLDDVSNRFPRIRVWGTIGWIVASWVFAWFWLVIRGRFVPYPPFFVNVEDLTAAERILMTSQVGHAMVVSGVVSIAYGLYALLLPHTPPKRDAVEKLAFWKAMKLFRHSSFLILMLAGLIIASIHNLYFAHTASFLKGLGLGEEYVPAAMSVGQIGEIVFMVFLGFLLKRLGFRWVLAIGALAYVIRFAAFGTEDLGLGVIIASQALHGVCFACYYATAFIYVDRIAESDVRHSAQTVVGIIIGAGPLLSGWLNQLLAGWYTHTVGGDEKLMFSPYWYAVAAIGGIAALMLAVFFRDQTKDKGEPALPTES